LRPAHRDATKLIQQISHLHSTFALTAALESVSHQT
jgi:hypothetical protein